MKYAAEVRSSIKRDLGDLAGVRVDAETAVRLNARAIKLALLHVRAGDTVGARARVERRFRDLPGSGTPLDYAEGVKLSIGYVALGNPERALQVLERVRPLSAAFGYGLRDPDLDPIRNNPRFQRLVAAARPPR